MCESLVDDSARHDGSSLSLRQAVAADFRTSTWAPRLALIGVCVWLAYEWGPGNETVTPWLLVRVMGNHDGARAIVVTAAVGFVFTTVQQLASGFTALVGFSIFQESARASWAQLISRDRVPRAEWRRLGWLSRAALVFGLGTTAVALIEIMSTGEIGVRRHAGAVGSSAVLCGFLVGVLGAAAGTLTLVGRSVDELRGSTEWILRTLGNPLLWLGLVIVVLVLHFRGAHRAP